MMEMPKYGGLCSNCKNASTCTYPKEPGQPVWYCCERDGYEESEGSVSLALLPSSTVSLRSIKSQADSKAGLSDVKYKGLCRNCENLERCTFPKPEEGVWHCEEYK